MRNFNGIKTYMGASAKDASIAVEICVRESAHMFQLPRTRLTNVFLFQCISRSERWSLCDRRYTNFNRRMRR